MKKACIALLLTISVWGLGQAPGTIDLEKLMDEIFPVQDENFNYEELYEAYAQWLAHPLNLNMASPEQIQSLLILTDQQLNDFIQYRTTTGPLLSLYELQVIPSFTEATIRLLSPFVRVDGQLKTRWKGLLTRITTEENNYWVTRIEHTAETRAGFKATSSPSIQYSGHAMKVYNRFRVSAPGDFSFGITTEQDAGESFLWRPSQKQLGFDFISAHAQVQNKGRLVNLTVGDFQAQFGQGLTLGGGFGMGKGAETITAMRRSNLGFIPYTSAVESGFFRGFGASMAVTKHMTIHGFASALPRDGRVQTNADSSETTASLFLSGLHRTPSERENRKTIQEENWGAVVQWKQHQLDVGFLAHRTSFSLPLFRINNVYNQFAFRGTHNTNLGMYANYAWRNYAFFGEMTQSLAAGRGLTAGVLASITPKFDIAVHYRHFDKNFYSFYANAIAESSIPQNEQGIYWGFKYRITKQQTIQGYADIFRFPWLRFQSYRPSAGYEWMGRYAITPSKTSLFFVQIRQEQKVRNLSGEYPTYVSLPGTKTNVWLNADYAASTTISFKTRLQWVGYTFDNTRTRGLVLLQDINVHWRKLMFSGRIALFDTDNYDTRIYLYERDAWLAFSIPALQGVGLRRYILLQFNATKKLVFWLRWANTTYDNRDSIGSQGETIAGNARNDFKLQARLKF
jgi:hypothetical protein